MQSPLKGHWKAKEWPLKVHCTVKIFRCKEIPRSQQDHTKGRLNFVLLLNAIFLQADPLCVPYLAPILFIHFYFVSEAPKFKNLNWMFWNSWKRSTVYFRPCGTRGLWRLLSLLRIRGRRGPFDLRVQCTVRRKIYELQTVRLQIIQSKTDGQNIYSQRFVLIFRVKTI